MNAAPGPSAAAPVEAVRTLLVDASATWRGLGSVLAGADEASRLALDRVDTLEAALERLAAGAADVVLLPLPQAGSLGLTPLVELRAAAPGVPVIVLVAGQDEALAVKAMQLGASHYLLAERLHGTLLARCLLHAVESERFRSHLALAEADRIPWPATARSGERRAAGLREAFPRVFLELVDDYRGLLDAAVEQLARPGDGRLERRVRRLAERAGELRAGPRDVIEIHAAAMKAREQDEGPRRLKLYATEGRMRLLELMGHLVTYYRDLSLENQRERAR
jgi:CheY-like chemotaxis protein